MARRVCYVCVCVCVCVGVCRGCLVGTPSGALIYNMKHYRTARFDGLYCSRGFTKIFGGKVCHHSARDFFRGGRREYYPPPLAAPQKIRPFFWATRHLPLTQLVDARCISLPQKDDIMEGRESPLSCYFVDHAAPQKLNTDNPNLRGELHATRTVCALHSSTHLIRETYETMSRLIHGGDGGDYYDGRADPHSQTFVWLTVSQRGMSPTKALLVLLKAS